MHTRFFVAASLAVAALFALPAAPRSQQAASAPATLTEALTNPNVFPPPPVRIKAGPGAAFKDADGNQWIPDRGFVGAESIERPDIQIAKTRTPQIYRSEDYSMSGFSYPVPNGKYTVKLHFAETYEGIGGPGDRVFSFTVGGKEFKDFDVWVKAGGSLTAYIETVPVTVTAGKVEITFTPNIQNPQINGIEILPAE
jgi:hypothetical protein